MAHVVEHKGKQTELGMLCGMGAGALWGLVFLAPELVRDFNPLMQAAGRYLAYGAIAGVLILPRWRRLSCLLSGRDWRAVVLLSLAGNTLYYVLLSQAVQSGGIALTSLIIGFLPVTVTVIGSRDQGAVPLKTLALSLVLCVAGALCICWQGLFGPQASGRTVQGMVCAVGALVSWTAYAVGNSRCLSRLRHVSVHDWNLLAGVVTGTQAVVLLPFALLAQTEAHSAGAWERFAGVSVGVAILASMCGNALWNRMSRLLPLTMTGQMILFETLFALLYGFVWEQRFPHPLELAAFGLVAGSVLSCVTAHRTHAPAQQAPVPQTPCQTEGAGQGM
ncbi:multidrug DMT transporter permease [Acetobacter malorum]|uniref:Multidrug DMT transporter permease n=1 Tax=Acetobacter malorum TaxID=178901 RepID=A0A149RU94_9PROT|nr:DMT family transporter [Acetobacter malorum]KXV17901.1 multidrug DMT transporter permease [Acetobacter malorum]